VEWRRTGFWSRELRASVGPPWRALIGAGYQVRAMPRKTSKRVNLAALDVEIVEGDMRDATAVARAIAGTRFLFHVAADYWLWARKPEEILVNNREGTRLLMQGGGGGARRLYKQRRNPRVRGERRLGRRDDAVE
jgi:hypothetical protein